MDVRKTIKTALHQLHIDKLRKHQQKPINSILDGQDTLVIAPTGSGKSIIYQVPALVHSASLTLVIEPTLALIYNQVHTLKEFGIAADYLDSTRSKHEIETVLKKAMKGKLTFLYVTPERLQSKTFCQAMEQVDLFMIVADECHCTTEWGYTFRDAYLKIGTFIDHLHEKPVICACSATIPEDSLDEIAHLLHMNKPQVFCSDLKRENLILLKKDMTSTKKPLEKRLVERIKALDKFIRKYWNGGSVAIYALTTGYVDAIYNHLDSIYPGQVARCHAQMKPDKLRHQMELDFLQGKRKIMVATTAFGMGIDVPDVELVVHFHTPISMTDYIQQIGRAGRDGRKAHCVLFYDQNGDDRRIFSSFQKKSVQHSGKAARVLTERYQQVQDFIDSPNCMVQDILRFQGQNEPKRCKCCTNCAKSRRGDHR